MRKVVCTFGIFVLFFLGYIVVVVVVLSVMEYIVIPLLGRYVMQDFTHTLALYTFTVEKNLFLGNFIYLYIFFSSLHCTVVSGWHFMSKYCELIQQRILYIQHFIRFNQTVEIGWKTKFLSSFAVFFFFFSSHRYNCIHKNAFILKIIQVFGGLHYIWTKKIKEKKIANFCLKFQFFRRNLGEGTATTARWSKWKKIQIIIFHDFGQGTHTHTHNQFNQKNGKNKNKRPKPYL